MLGDLAASPTAHVTRTTLPDGTQQTVVDDPPRRIHAVATVHGTTFRMELTQPAKGSSETDNVDIGNVTVHDVTRKNGMEHLVIETTRAPAMPVGVLFMTSIVMGFIIASVLGGVLSKENDGHLELAWTKPVSRERYAIGAFVVDAAAIIASQVLWMIVFIIGMAMFGVLRFTAEPNAALHAGIALLGPTAWYAAITAWSASLKRGPGIVIGLGWPIALSIPGGAAALSGATHPLLVAIRTLLLALSYIDPLTYIHSSWSGGHVTMAANAVRASVGFSCAALAALIIVYLALAVAQWRRVEA
jgi:ABC-type transport system involved in multi-copper enzyme maturation permease subunit